MAGIAAPPERAELVAVARGHGAAADRASRDAADNAQLRTTCVTTMLEAGHAENALPQRARATIQCRLLPGDMVQDGEARLASILDEPQLRLRITKALRPSVESVPSNATMNDFKRALESGWPNLPVVPVMDAGGSDSVYTRFMGLNTYGAPSIFVDLNDIRAHGKDERIGVRNFFDGTDIAYRIMRRFAHSR